MSNRGSPGSARRGRALCGAALAALAVLLWVWLAPAELAAGAARAPLANPVDSVFFIAKSENRNQVHYAVQVDAHCRPKGAQPVYGYWRDFEDGPNARSPLLEREQSVYGLTRPKFVRSAQNGGQIGIGLRGFPERPLTIQVFRMQDECRARALTTIAGAPAVLRSIYVELAFLFGIDYVLLRGYRLQDGKPVQEKMND